MPYVDNPESERKLLRIQLYKKGNGRHGQLTIDMLDLLMKKNVPRVKTMSSIRGAIFFLQRLFVAIQRRNAAFMLWSMDQLSDGLLAYLFMDIILCHLKKVKELFKKN